MNYSGGKKKKIKFRVSPIILFFMLSFLACFAFYMLNSELDGTTRLTVKEQFSDQASSTLDEVEDSVDDSLETTLESTEPLPTETSDLEQPSIPVSNPLPESARKDRAYLDDCVFIGDSISVGLGSYSIIPETNVLAGIGLNSTTIQTKEIDTAYGTMTILDALKTTNFNNVYIMLGSNGIAWIDSKDIVASYGEFLDNVKKEKPEANIYILSIPPVTAGKEVAGDSPVKNSTIDAYNSDLLKMANSKKVNFVDLNTALKGNDGKLSTSYAANDGMHFKKSTYDKMIDYILTHTVS